MRVVMRDLVLYGLGLLTDEDEPRPIDYSKTDLASCLEISTRTLDNYLTDLSKTRLITRTKKRYADTLDQIIRLTSLGRDRFREIIDELNSLILVPERHFITRPIEVESILDQLGNPLEKLFFISTYSRHHEFDLPLFLRTVSIMKEDSNVLNTIQGLDAKENGMRQTSFIETFSRTSLHGLGKAMRKIDINRVEKSINASLIYAEALQKNGDLQGSLNIYRSILQPHNDITDDQWFIAKMGMIHCLRKIGDVDSAIDMIDRTFKEIEKNVYKGYLNQIKALILSMTGEFDESLHLYKSTIGYFHLEGNPLLLAIAYNNRGTLYYRVGKYDEAVEDWNKARNYAKQADSDYCLSATFMNLAHIEAMRNNFGSSLDLIDRAERITIEIGDKELQSGSLYNRALTMLYMKKGKEAVYHFNRSMMIAYPLPSPLEREERRASFRSVAEKNGVLLDDHHIVMD